MISGATALMFFILSPSLFSASSRGIAEYVVPHLVLFSSAALNSELIHLVSVPRRVAPLRLKAHLSDSGEASIPVEIAVDRTATECSSTTAGGGGCAEHDICGERSVGSCAEHDVCVEWSVEGMEQIEKEGPFIIIVASLVSSRRG